jgi:hypothetical protein
MHYQKICFIIGFICLVLFGCKEKQRKEFCKVLKAKHYENESINNMGNFRVIHYFMFEDLTTLTVDLNSYMQFNIGDNVCWTQEIE